MTSERRGLLLTAAAYTIWGTAALFWRLVHSVSPVELLAQRITWSVVLLVFVVSGRRRWPEVRATLSDRRRLAAVAGSSALLATNWGSYIFAVTHGRVVETAIGYSMVPLLSAVVGVRFLGEHLRHMQAVAIAIASVAVLVLAIAYGRPPWVALVIAASWTTYSVLKRRSAMAPIEGLLAETSVLFPLAVVFVAVTLARGTSALQVLPAGRVLVLFCSALITTVPLVLFAAGTRRISLVQSGMLQYINPVIAISLGVLAFHEPMPPLRLAGVALLAIALAVFTADSTRAGRQVQARELAAV